LPQPFPLEIATDSKKISFWAPNWLHGIQDGWRIQMGWKEKKNRVYSVPVWGCTHEDTMIPQFSVTTKQFERPHRVLILESKESLRSTFRTHFLDFLPWNIPKNVFRFKLMVKFWYMKSAGEAGTWNSSIYVFALWTMGKLWTTSDTIRILFQFPC
jgi:hypothetical protein